MEDKRVDIFKLLENEGKLTTIWLYPAIETVADPYEKNTIKNFLNPIPIKGLIMDISYESLRWKYYGNIPTGSKQLICESKWINHFKIADKIKIEDDYYKTMKDDAKNWMMMKRADHLVVILGKKNGN